MKKGLSGFLLFLFLLVNFTVQSQIIEGTILDSKSKETLPGATVYLDGTTISTITDLNGNFSINTKSNNATLVVSFVGYSTYRLDNPLQYVDKKVKVMLVEESISLEEVVIGKGPFSRKQMMRVFRTEFLGESKAGKSCKILNEDDIVLYFDVSNNTLNVSARNPLKIINKHLEYEVNFDLEELIVHYNYKSLSKFNQIKSFFSGTTFYKDLSKNNKADKKRRETFYGSATHFAHTLANEAWEKEDIQLFVDSWPANPKDYFKVTDTLGIKKVTLIKEPLKEIKNFTLDKKPSNAVTYTNNGKIKLVKTNFNILYNKKHQSILEFTNKVIYVDNSGHYFPVYGIIYGGYIGSLKAGDILPIDYYQTIKEIQKH